MQMTPVDPTALTYGAVESFLALLTTSGHLDLRHTIVAQPGDVPALRIELEGPDTPLLIARHGELLLAIEHIAAKLLRLEPDQHDRISIDAASFKADRDRQMQADAQAAIAYVKETGRPFSFPPMTSRERRMLHLALQPSGLPTASTGENPRRFVVLYPMAGAPEPAAPTVSPDRTHLIKSAFRRR